MNENMQEKEPTVELRIQDLLMSYLRQWKLIVLCVIITCTLAWGYTYFCMTPMYRASATIYINNSSSEEQEGLSSADLTASIHLVKGYMILAKSESVLELAAAELNGDYTTAQLRGAISTSQINDTVILSLNVSHPNPEEAARIANVMAEVLPKQGPKVFVGSSASVVDTARIPSGYYSPDYSSNIVTGGVAGLLLAVVYITIMFLKDTRIKDENDLTDMFNLPILGRIPNFDDAVTGNRYTESDSEEGGEV